MNSPLAPGTKLGRYEIRSQLGMGGMGVVYLADDAQLQRRVAIKVLPKDVASSRSRVWRFEQEAKAAAALNHPNIAHVYEIGEDQGTHFIAMEYVDGHTLTELIQNGQTELVKFLRYLQHTAEGLAKAHDAGIVHRDLKPDNIMITRDGHAKVMDFGLAKLIEPRGVEDAEGIGDEANTVLAASPHRPFSPALTSPGTVLGTVGYMSPEQAQGKTDQIDHRSDIFAFGCILFEVVTGNKAFDGTDTIDILNKIIRQPVPPITDFRSDVPTHLQRIIRRCVAKDPEARYQTIKDVAIELKELRLEMASGDGIEPATLTSNTMGSTATLHASPTSPSSSAPNTTSASIDTDLKRNKVAAVLTLLILLIGAGALAFYLRSRNVSDEIESIAVLPFQNKSTEPDTEYLSDGLAESLIYRLSQLPHLKVSPTSSVFHYKGKEIDPVKVGQELGVSAVLSGRMVQRGDSLTISVELVDVRNNKLLWGEQYERKMSDLLTTQREIAHEIVEKLKLKVSGDEKGLAKQYTDNNEAYQLYLKGRFYWNKRSNDGFEKALEYFQQAIDRDPNFALAYAGLADTYDLIGGPEAGGDRPPNEVLPKAKVAALKAMQLDETLAEPHVSLAHATYYYDRDWAGAEREFKKAIELNPNYPQAHFWYAVYLAVIVRREEALTEIRRAQDLDPLSLPINAWVGRILALNGQYDQAIEQLRKTLDMDPNFILAIHRLALVYEEKGMYDEAVAEFQHVLKLSGGRPLAVAGLARQYALMGKRDEAQKNLDALLQLWKERYVSPTMIALIYSALGNSDKAFEWLDTADKAHDLNIVRIKEDFRFNSLRSDPRFTALVRRIGIP